MDMKQILPSHVHIQQSASICPSDLPVEIVERKGVGHPDTIADSLAEAVSIAYSAYTRERFGAILHHQVDKLLIKGGRWNVSFGSAQYVAPIRVLLNGRFSTKFGNIEIPIREIAEAAIWARLKNIFPDLSNRSHVTVEYFYNSASNTSRWYEPKNLEDVPDAAQLWSNDTSVVTAACPLSLAESITLEAERLFYAGPFNRTHKHIGQDIKVMTVRVENDYFITMCLPFIAELTPSRDFYMAEQERLHKMILSHLAATFELPGNLSVFINTQDNNNARDHVYLTPFGSCIGIGEEGVVGRGNNAQGIISTFRPYSMEAPFGKNPAYHTGRIMAVVLPQMARSLSSLVGADVCIQAVTQNGGSIAPPAFLLLQFSGSVDEDAVMKYALDPMHFSSFTDDIAAGQLLPVAW